ncbi:MAG: cbb3-type cytochrome oxidase assembly protein CcoS [Methylophilaceae bacterium]|jgi:cbb3-type cytochrome oxidase maturation protein|nr:cbb3-type cytochrome oxidase assembly protein CcoS [Methylophilaceae bacterium]
MKLGLNGLFFQLGLTLVFVGLAAAGILWAIKSGQYDDLDGPAQRILMDDDDPMIPFNAEHPRSHELEPDQTKSK